MKKYVDISSVIFFIICIFFIHSLSFAAKTKKNNRKSNPASVTTCQDSIDQNYESDAMCANVCNPVEFKAFGDKDYIREKGKPQRVNDTFTISNLGLPYVLRIYDHNGEDYESHKSKKKKKHKRETYLKIAINNRKILSKHDFENEKSFFEIPLDACLLLGENTILTEVKGKPGGAFTINISGICTDSDCDGFALEGGQCGPIDCDDTNPAIYPGAKEICEDEIDQDCNGNDLPCVLKDIDGDLFSEAQGDCDDTNPDIFPGATDIPENGIDEDCNGEDASAYHLIDMDSDGYTAFDGDCHDQNPNVYPEAEEITCNGIDEDCDGADLCDQAPEVSNTSAYIDGEVFDASTDAPIANARIKMADVGQSITNEDGKFSFPTPDEGVYLVLIEKEGYTYAQRRIRVESGHDFAVDPVYLVPLDPIVASITPEDGGHLVNSTQEVELHFEPDTVSETVGVSATRFHHSKELPGDLPPTSFFTCAVELLPDGLSLKKPVRLLVENTLDFAPGTPVPVGYYRKDLGQWVPDGMGKITSNGKYMEYYVRHFSPYDLNFPASPPENATPPRKDTTTNETDKINEPKPCGKAGNSGQSKVVFRDGELMEEYALPSYHALGQSHSVSLMYTSTTANPQSILSMNYDIDSEQMTIPEKIEFETSVGGIKRSGVYWGAEGSKGFKFLFNAINFQEQQLQTGVYPYSIKLTNWYNGYYNLAKRFGDPALGYALDSRGNPITVDVPMKKDFSGQIIINNQVNSAFGAGWNMSDLYRIYPWYNDSVILISGAGSKKYFQPNRIIETLAGGGEGRDDGVAELVALNSVTAVATDAHGNIVIADGNREDRIRLIDPSGIIKTIVGNFVEFSCLMEEEPPAPKVELAHPKDVAIDNAGNIYIADKRNYRIRCVDPTGTITTIAGNGNRGYSGDGGLATQAMLNYPYGIEVDNVGNIYIADSYNSRIRRIDPSGIISTIAGNGSWWHSGDGGPAIDAELAGPKDIAVDNSGNIYIADTCNNVIRRIDPSGIITTIAGSPHMYGYSGDGGPATEATFRKPFGIAVDNTGNIYIADRENNCIRRIDPRGIIATIAGNGNYGYSGDGGPAIHAELASPVRVAVDKAGNIYIADKDNKRIRVVKQGTNANTGLLISPDGDYSTLTRNEDDTYTRIMKDGITYHFNAQGLQTSKVDTNGQTTNYFYDESNRLIRITDPVGLSTIFTFDDDTLSSITDPAGRTTQFIHDSDNNLTHIIAPDGSTTSFTYDASHLLTSKTDPLSRSTRYYYDTHGMIERVEGPDESINHYSPSQRYGLINELAEGEGIYGNPTTGLSPQNDIHTDPEGNITVMKTDKYGRLTAKTDALGNVTTYERDIESGNITTIHNPNGATIQKEYDDKGNLISLTDALGNTNTYSFESTYNKIKSITDPLGRVRTFDYDAKGNLISITDPLGNTTTMAYYGNGLLYTITNANGATTTYEYDTYGNMIKRTDALGNISTYTYDAAGNRVSFADALGNTTLYSYDTMNNLTDITAPMGEHIRYTYDAAGNRRSMTDANGNSTQYQYDNKNRLIKAIDPLGHEIVYTYDKNGHIVTETDEKDATTHYTYNTLGRLITKTDPLGNQTTYTYDAMGNLSSMTDSLGNIMYHEYDLNNQQVKIIDPQNGETEFGYDEKGNLISLTNANGYTTYFSYDSIDRNLSMTTPSNEQELYSYDNVGNLTQKTLYNGDEILYEYDSLDRLRRKTFSNGEMTTFNYDLIGNITTITNLYSHLSFDYDNNNRLITAYTGATAYQADTTIFYAYDANGNRIRMTDPLGAVANYAYDTRNSLSTLTTSTNQVYSFAYDEKNQRISKTLPNDLISLYSYNLNGNLTALNHNLDITTLSNFSYLYNAIQNRTKLTDIHGDYDYTYDQLYQLLQATHPQISTETFTYDPIGNRISSSGSSDWSYDACNRLLDDGAFTYQYTNGCLTQKINKSNNEVITYTYNTENQLTGIRTPCSAIFYYYDGLGRRICKEVNGVKTYYIYDSEDILYTLDSTSNMVNYYTHGPGIDEPLEVRIGGTTYYYLSDGLGSINQIADSLGNIQQEYTYDSFGNIVNQAGIVNNPYTYTGREFDSESGLYYYRARFYDPRIGRFLTQDPIGFAGGDTNLYTYCMNNPVNWIDPWGFFTVSVGITISGGLGIGGGGGTFINIGHNSSEEMMSGWSASLTGTAGAGAFAGAGGSTEFNLQITNADNVTQLEGKNISTGKSGGAGIVGGAEYIQGENYKGFGLHGGFGVKSTPSTPITTHFFGETTSRIIGWEQEKINPTMGCN
ncbi:MAG: RHS repeat-associated core domain-containing protein [bacterium]